MHFFNADTTMYRKSILSFICINKVKLQNEIVGKHLHYIISALQLRSH